MNSYPFVSTQGMMTFESSSNTIYTVPDTTGFTLPDLSTFSDRSETRKTEVTSVHHRTPTMMTFAKDINKETRHNTQ